MRNFKWFTQCFVGLFVLFFSFLHLHIFFFVTVLQIQCFYYIHIIIIIKQIASVENEKFVNTLIDEKIIEAVSSVFDGKEDKNTQVSLVKYISKYL